MICHCLVCVEAVSSRMLRNISKLAKLAPKVGAPASVLAPLVKPVTTDAALIKRRDNVVPIVTKIYSTFPFLSASRTILFY